MKTKDKEEIAASLNRTIDALRIYKEVSTYLLKYELPNLASILSKDSEVFPNGFGTPLSLGNNTFLSQEIENLENILTKITAGKKKSRRERKIKLRELIGRMASIADCSPGIITKYSTSNEAEMESLPEEVLKEISKATKKKETNSNK